MWVLLGLVLGVAAELAIRAGEPTTTGTSGVDLIQVPWQDPEPDVFVTEVTHPWWPMAPGSSWEFRRGLESDGGPEATVETWRVAPRRTRVGGIEVTALYADDRVLQVAQDRDGNLWLLGERTGVEGGSWSIEDGSPAGLLLPAEPRRGDGYALSVRDGVVLERVETGDFGQRPVEVPGHGERGSLEIELVRPLEDEARTTLQLARGVGPVSVTSLEDGVRLLTATGTTTP